MIQIRTEQCTGCGACLEVCPTGALYLADGKATVEASLCRECEACIAACPTEAIAISEQQPRSADQPAYALARPPEPAATLADAVPLPMPWRSKVLPVMGAALAWVGREIVPRLADRFLDSLTSRPGGERTDGRNHSRRQGRQFRRRRRGRTDDR